MHRHLLGLLPCLLLAASPAHAAGGDFTKYEELEAMVAQLEADAVYAPGELKAVFDKVSRQDKVLELIARPAEGKEWKDYRPLFMTDSRVRDGLAFWDKHADAFARAEAATGVPQAMILAILGVETKYGFNKGGFRVVDTLATLGFDYPPRASFFRKELREFLILARQSGLDPLSVKGSYAGAMGYPQFMPSSWRNLAIDFDEDGKIDLINNPVDAIGSIANYFKANGWVKGEPVALRARISGNTYDTVTSKELKTVSTLGELAKAGLVPRAESPLDEATPASGIRLQGANGGEFWVGFNNFYVITKYNRSILYAMAAHQLAEALEKGRQDALKQTIMSERPSAP